jgi:hypothetical protein
MTKLENKTKETKLEKRTLREIKVFTEMALVPSNPPWPTSEFSLLLKFAVVSN